MILSHIVVSICFVSNVVKKFTWPHSIEKIEWLKSRRIEQKPIGTLAVGFWMECMVSHLDGVPGKGGSMSPHWAISSVILIPVKVNNVLLIPGPMFLSPP